MSYVIQLSVLNGMGYKLVMDELMSPNDILILHIEL